ESPLEEYLQDLKTVLVQGIQIEVMQLVSAPSSPAPDPLP
ncbi:MAG: TIGR03899 family protein, partial [Aeromonas veronii]